jgi:hypothetical protein
MMHDATHLIILSCLDPLHSLINNHIVTKAQVFPEPEEDAACTITVGCVRQRLCHRCTTEEASAAHASE